MRYRAFETTFWLVCGTETAVPDRMAGPRPRFFTIKVPRQSGGPIEGLYELRLSVDEQKRRSVACFAWELREGLGLPSLFGRIVARRFGPIESVNVKARYEYADDPASRLFDEALGERLGESAFEALVAAVRSARRRPSVPENAAHGTVR